MKPLYKPIVVCRFCKFSASFFGVMLVLNVRTDFQHQQNSSQTLKTQIIWLTIGLKYPVWNLQHLLLVDRL
jgi:hypothetical protein